jgi:HlyD family secretion protein
LKKIRLILIEDNRLLREGISAMLKKEKDIIVVASLDDSDFALEKLTDLKPNVVLIDLGLTNQDSFELVKLIRDEYKDIEVIVMDLVPLQEDIFRFVEAGVSGFIL